MYIRILTWACWSSLWLWMYSTSHACWFFIEQRSLSSINCRWLSNSMFCFCSFKPWWPYFLSFSPSWEAILPSKRTNPSVNIINFNILTSHSILWFFYSSESSYTGLIYLILNESFRVIQGLAMLACTLYLWRRQALHHRLASTLTQYERKR